VDRREAALGDERGQPWAWLPDETVATPRSRAVSESAATAL
jgi:hypothetical protein